MTKEINFPRTFAPATPLPERPARGIMSGVYVGNHTIVQECGLKAVQELDLAIHHAEESNVGTYDLAKVFHHADEAQRRMTYVTYLLHIGNADFPAMRETAWKIAHSISRDSHNDTEAMWDLRGAIYIATSNEIIRLAEEKGLTVLPPAA